MIKIKVLSLDSMWASDPNLENKELSPIENFIAQIGYEVIKDIKIVTNGSSLTYYHIFYEDGLPYTPRPMPEKKGLFG